MDSRSPPRFASGVLPREHGSWSLVLEPLALGLLAAPSLAGGALAGAAVAAFLARRPLRQLAAVSTDQCHRPAIRALALCGGSAALLLAAAIRLGSLSALWPLALAAPAGLAFLWFDRLGESRAAVAEFAGATACALLSAVCAALAGWPVASALALSGVMAARSLPAVASLRAFLRGRKDPPVRAALPLGLAFVAFGGTTALASHHLAPWSAVAAVTIFLLRSLWLFGPRPSNLRATQIGLIEAALGAAFVLTVGLTWPQ